MKKILKLILPLLTVSAIALSASGAGANMIQNGSFEEPVIAYGSWTPDLPVPGWKVEYGYGIEIQNHVAGDPQHGNNHVELDTHYNSSISQTISTSSGVKYNLSFWYSPRPNVSEDSNIINVYFNGTLIDSITGYSANVTDWKPHTYPLTALSDSSVLMFEAAGISDSVGGYIDNVSMTPTPVPAALWLFGSGIAGMAAIRRRKKSI
jgi:hypothetical protein